MNAEQVCEMIDAITEGREYEYTNNKTSCMIVHPDEGVLFSADFDTSFEVTDPRTAREIAAALIAWANRSEGGTIEHKIESNFFSKRVEDQLNLYRKGLGNV